MVAVVTPETVTAGQPPVQYGCIAIGFDLNSPSVFSPSVAAVISDVDTQDVMGAYGYYYESSPNACTYEPKSNTGMNIVRHLVQSNVMYPTQYQIYSIIDSGVMP